MADATEGNESIQSKSDAESVEQYDMTIPYCILIAINFFVIAPVGSWLTIRYVEKQDKYPYNARRPKLVIRYNMFALFFVCIYIPLHIVFFEILWDNNNTVDEWWESVSYNSILTALSVALSLRIWHSFYDFQLSHYSSRQWKSILTEDTQRDNDSFIFRYKHFLGKSSWVIHIRSLIVSKNMFVINIFVTLNLSIHYDDTGKSRKTYLWIMLIPFGVFVLIMYTFLAFEIFVDEHHEVMGTLILFIYIYHLVALIMNAVVMVVTIRTWNTVHDNIHVRTELILQTAVLWLSYIIFLSIYLCDPVFESSKERYDSVYYFGYFTEHSISAFLSILIGTLYLPFRMWQKQQTQRSPRPTGLQRTDSVSQSESFVDPTTMDFQSVITIGNGLQSFMNHLAKEKGEIYLIVKLIH